MKDVALISIVEYRGHMFCLLASLSKNSLTGNSCVSFYFIFPLKGGAPRVLGYLCTLHVFGALVYMPSKNSKDGFKMLAFVNVLLETIS